MEPEILQIETNAWRVTVGNLTHIIRFRNNTQTFAPWDVIDIHGRRVWSSFSFDGACSWILRRQPGGPAAG